MVCLIVKMFSEYFVFVIVDINDYFYMLGSFGFDIKGLCLQVLQNGQVYYFEGDEMIVEVVQLFVQMVFFGKVQFWSEKSGGSIGYEEF